MNRMHSVTATGSTAKKLKKHGRNGDTEMAHVEVGEKVVPLSIQTPAVRSVLSQEFKRQGVPEDRYTVQPTGNSTNPQTGGKEYFLKKLTKAVIPAAVGFATGGPAGAAMGAASSLMSPSGAGGGNAAASGMAMQIPGQGGGVRSGLTSTTTESPENYDFDRSASTAANSPMLPSIVEPTPRNSDELMRIALMSGFRNPDTGVQQFYDIKRSDRIMDKSMARPSINKDTGKNEFFSTYMSAEQIRATEWARDKGILGANETATNGLLNARLASNPALEQQYYSFMQSPSNAIRPVQAGAALASNAPASPNAPYQQPAASYAQPQAGAALAQTGGGQAQPPAQQGATSGQGLYVVSAIPGNGRELPDRYLLSDGSTRTALEMKTLAMPAGSGNLSPAMSSQGRGDFGGFTSYMQPKQSLIGFKIPDSAQPKLNSSTTSAAPQFSPQQIDKATQWGQSKNLLQPNERAVDGRLDRAIGSNQDLLSEYDNFMRNGAYTPQPQQQPTQTQPDFNSQFDSFKSEIDTKLNDYFSKSDTTTQEPAPATTEQFSSNNALPTFSTLTPERNNRFRSRAGEGSLARNF
jgi:hypothetical protein